MELALLFFKTGIALLVGLFLAGLFRQDLKHKLQKKYLSARDKSFSKTQRNPEKKFAYDAMEEKLLAQGIKYRMGAEFSPFDYMVFRLLISFGLGLVCMLIKPWFFPGGFAAGYVMVPLYFKQEDGNDNERMLPDIGQMNSIVALQIKNGVFISKVIYECYRSVENARLKQALLELSIDIENFASVKQAAQRFRKKFNNPYIDGFAKTLEQVQDTGKSLEFFEDILSRVESINDAIAIRQEHKAEQVAGFFQILLFLGPVILVFYIILGMFTSAGSLW